MSYPGIERATLLIALDNGGINRNRSEEQQKAELEAFFVGRREDLAKIDAWLLSLTNEQLETACCGEHDEMAALLASAPPGTDQFLNDYFDEVC